eukprot:6652481-Prymnesium_polylepis.1
MPERRRGRAAPVRQRCDTNDGGGGRKGGGHTVATMVGAAAAGPMTTWRRPHRNRLVASGGWRGPALAPGAVRARG